MNKTRVVGKFKIEKGIPLPPAGGGTGFCDALRSMDIGDSTLLQKTGKSQAYKYSIKRLAPLKFATRTVTGGIRIWRVE